MAENTFTNDMSDTEFFITIDRMIDEATEKLGSSPRHFRRESVNILRRLLQGTTEEIGIAHAAMLAIEQAAPPHLKEGIDAG